MVLACGRAAVWAGYRRGHLAGHDRAPSCTRRRSGPGEPPLRAAGLLTYVHTDPPAAGVYTRNVLHHLPDFWKAMALSRIARMLQPGGILRLKDLIYDFEPSQAEAVFGLWLDGAAQDPASLNTRPRRF